MKDTILDYPTSNNDFITFRKFEDKAMAADFAKMLQENKFSVTVEDTSGDEPFGNKDVGKEFRVKLRQFDFPAANKFLLEISKLQVENVEADYYLFSFPDEELIEIVSKPDEWNEFDFILAQKILKEKGKEISSETIDKIASDRMKILAQPEKSHKSWIIFGYISALCGGVTGTFLGWHILTHRKSLPNGERVFAFSKSDRKHGNRIFILGVACLLLLVFTKFFIL